MACKDCEEKRRKLRSAVLHGRMAEAMDITIEGLRTIITINAGADHRKEAELAKMDIVGDEDVTPARRGPKPKAE
jgi:hypothetical protein